MEKAAKHVQHTLALQCTSRHLRLLIAKPATNWGVSMWQFDVLGYYVV